MSESEAKRAASEVSSQEQTEEKLRMLAASLKKKYGEAVTHAYNLETKSQELARENASLKQTQNVLTQKFNETLVALHSLEEKFGITEKECEESKLASDESQQEVLALREQHAHLKSCIEKHEENEKKISEELQAIKLKEAQLERVIQFLRKRSEEAHLETNQISGELSQAQELTQNLNNELLKINHLNRELKENLKTEKEEKKNLDEELSALKEQLKALNAKFSDLQETAAGFQKDNQDLHDELIAKHELLESIQKEHQFLKQVMMKSAEEAQEKFEKFERETEEKHAALKDENEKREKALSEEIEALKHQISLFEAREEEIKKTEALKEELEEERKLLFSEKEALHGRIESLEAEKNELDQKFRTAQQHLAKKVRETTIVNERIEVEKGKTAEMQNQLNAAQIKISELNNTLELEVEHQKRLLQRETDLLKNAENQIQRLEEKYFQMHEKWSQAEAEMKDLKKMEEKFREMQAFFSNFGNVFPSAQKPAVTTVPISEPEPLVVQEPQPEKVREQITLFETPKQRYKDSFL